MTAPAKPVRVVLLARAAPLLDAPPRVWGYALLGLALSAVVLLRAGYKIAHHT